LLDKNNKVIFLKENMRIKILVFLSLLLIPAFLFFDIHFPLGVAGGVPYVALVLIGLITQRPNTIIIMAVLGSILTIVGFYISPVSDIAVKVVWINRGLAIFAIWSVAIVSFIHLKALARLEPLATRDQLTNLFNRHYFSSEIVRQINFWRRHQQPLSILLLDIDFFKKVNDNYGHITGDYALKTIADICLKQVRDGDTIARVGGEEFAILLPATAINGAMQMAERIRAAVEIYKFKYENKEFNITVSIGATEITDESWSITELLKAVDKMMYEAKRTGRNRCVASHINEPV
jgi:diguanylate cyclase (GGDEF)-like protein